MPSPVLPRKPPLGPIGRLSQGAADGALPLLAMITFLGEHRVITDPVAAMLIAGQTTGRRCSVRHQPLDDDLSDHAQHVTRRDLALANCALLGNGPIWAPSTAFRRIYNSPLRRSATMPSVPVVLLATKDSRSHSADAFGIADYVKLDDLVINDSESHYAVRLPIERDDDSGGTVDQRRKEHRRRIGTEARLSSDSNCAANDRGRSRAARAEIDSQDDVWVEHGDQCVKVTTASCQEEGIDDRALTSEVGIRDIGAPYPTPCPARELPGGSRGSIDHRSDLLEWQIEHVMENEGQPLGRSQGVEYDQES